MSSFFKRPSWAAKSAEEAETEFYRRSKNTYSDIVAANREARQKSKASSPPEDPEQSENTTPKKRPRVSEEHKDSDETPDTPIEADSDKSVPAKSQEAPDSARGSSSAPVNQYNHDQYQANQQHSPEKPPHAPVNQYNQYLASRQQHGSGKRLYFPYPMPKSPIKQSPLPVQSPTVVVDAPKTQSPQAPPASAIQPNRPVIRSPRPVQPTPPPADDPVVQIMISSEIPNTKPLLVQRKLSQSLRDVRIAWCNRQNFSPEMQSSIYLTWKGRRLFDATTCRSIAAQIKKSSSSIIDLDDDQESELRIHIEAVTDIPLPATQQTTSPDNDNSPAVSQTPEDDRGEPMKLVLRSPGLEDFKIKARKTTAVSRLISAFRDKQQVPVDRDISLEFDGDILKPDTCLGDYDIDNLDLVDVLIK
ncbi:hypothetical protein N7461_005409 [Penicillium sp. DV-2018c]|nr:hypothetical protein N7461_005409 [Penicillium sp. DV-2018c]